MNDGESESDQLSPELSRAVEAAKARIRELNQAASPAQPTKIGDIGDDPTHRQAVAAAVDAENDVKLKTTYAWALLGLMALGFVMANFFFFRIASEGYQWKVPTDVINVFLAATIIQLVGLAAIVTRYLFPRRGTDR